MASDRHKKLDESNALHQFYRDVDDEESWIKLVALLGFKNASISIDIS